MSRLRDDGHCFICGKDNPAGLALSFKGGAEGGAGEAEAAFVLGKQHQGYEDVVHGGILSALLDEAIVKAAINQGLMPVTAELTVRFKALLMVGQEAVVRARVKSPVGRLLEGSAEIKRVVDGKVIATAKAKLINH